MKTLIKHSFELHKTMSILLNSCIMFYIMFYYIFTNNIYRNDINVYLYYILVPFIIMSGLFYFTFSIHGFLFSIKYFKKETYFDSIDTEKKVEKSNFIKNVMGVFCFILFIFWLVILFIAYKDIFLMVNYFIKILTITIYLNNIWFFILLYKNLSK